jgi:excisionase family DNA binding protein
VAELWHVSVDTVYRLITRGLLATTEVGIGRSKTRVAESALAAFVAKRTTPARRRVA